MNDGFAKALGFESASEMNRLIASADLVSDGALQRFEEWKLNNGTKEGLLKLQPNYMPEDEDDGDEAPPLDLVILFRRGSHTDDDEFNAARALFPVHERRTQIQPGSLVIPRYSALPFYRELEADVQALGAQLINSYAQHRFAADIMQWYPVLGDQAEPYDDLEDDESTPGRMGLTPRTWSVWGDLPKAMSFVVKGATNSRKHEWNKRFFAPSRDDVPRIADSLMDDALLVEQGIVVREFVPLRTFAIGINGLPITNEWRVFCLDGQIVDAGYYWASEPDYEWSGVDEVDALAADCYLTHPDGALRLRPTLEGQAPLPAAARACAEEALRRIGDRINFVVIDVAERASGGWIVIELNDGSMSGLSCIPPTRFYSKLVQPLLSLTINHTLKHFGMKP